MSEHRVLEGRVAVVTGAGAPVGRSIALAMAAHGASVVVNDPSHAGETAAQIREAGGEAAASDDPVAEHAGARRIVEAALDAYGRLDIVVVGPASSPPERLVSDMGREEWDEAIAVHLKAHFNLIQPASALMREQRSGRIVTFSSAAGLWGEIRQAAHGAATDGVAGLTRVVARDLGRYGVTCNAIAPSAETLAPGGPAHLAEAVAAMAVWLASEAASDVNGQVFSVDGGLVGLVSHPSAGRTITKPGAERWTVEELAALFPATLGMDLPNPAPARPA